MEFSTLDQTEIDDEEYRGKDHSSGENEERELEERKNRNHEDGEVKPSSRSRYRASRRKKKLNLSWPKKKQKGNKFWVKLVFKIVLIVAVYYNINFLLNFMKDPVTTFSHTLVVVGICIGINFIAAWILFYKNSHIRFYLSLIATLGSIGYYFYINNMNHSFLGSNLITSVLVLISVLIAISLKSNYYLKSFFFLLIPIIGIYFSANKFALVWALMFDAGLILFFRKSKSNKKEAKTKREEKHSA